MSRVGFVFICGMLITLITQAIENRSYQTFETIHSLTFNDVNIQEVGQFFGGEIWLEDKISSKPLDLQNVYQTKAFTKQLQDNSVIKKYQKSYTTWIEEKICPQSPYIDKPVKASITSRYGNRIHPISGYSHVHAGIDFRGQTGTSVFAASDGIVKVVGRKGAYGKTIIIDHGDSFTTLYGHLSGYSVKPNQWVHMGQTIGYIGQTGRATGPHLHFEVRCHNAPLNPLKYVGKMGIAASVRFKRYNTANIAYRMPTSRMQTKSAAYEAPEKRDPNYYTRLINLQKLEALNSKAQTKF